MKKLLFCSLLSFCTTSFAIDLQLKSTEKQTQVIELFTSEGCSSCPPADRWLSSLKKESGLWTDFIPLAFHVDYWDYIGWKDPYASSQNSMRQRAHRILNNIPSVYTPGVLKAGKEWRSWRHTDIKKASKNVGQLSIDITNNQLRSTFDSTDINDYQLSVALIAMDLKTAVKAGENIGKKLKHDFVVLKHQTFNVKGNSYQTKLDESFFHSEHSNVAFVAWVESNLVPIQAVGQPL